MAGALDYLFGSTPPPNVTANTVTSNGLPDWYQSYLQGIAGKATDIAGQQQSQALPAQSVAGFNPDELQAQQQIRNNQGAWQPLTAEATTAAQGIAPAAQSYANQAQQAAAGPAAQFPSNFSQYMSPYTQSVVDNISRLGNQNFNEQIMPGVNSSMIGNGQFGSTRNAAVLGQAARDEQANISGQQANALQSGYGTSAGIFASDAARQQAQQQMQAATALQGGTNVASGLQGASTALGGLGQATSGLGLADAQTLAASGQTQQGQQQAGLDTAYSNSINAYNAPYTALNNVSSAIRGLQLPSSSVQSVNEPLNAATYGSGSLGALGQAYGATKTNPVAIT